MIYFLAAVILLFSWFAPWWWFVPLFFFVGFRAQSLKQSVFWGFVPVFVSWFIVAYYCDLRSHGLIGASLAKMMQLPSSFLIYLLTASIGGLSGAVACLCGSLFHRYQQMRRLPRVEPRV